MFTQRTTLFTRHNNLPLLYTHQSSSCLVSGNAVDHIVELQLVKAWINLHPNNCVNAEFIVRLNTGTNLQDVTSAYNLAKSALVSARIRFNVCCVRPKAYRPICIFRMTESNIVEVNSLFASREQNFQSTDTLKDVASTFVPDSSNSSGTKKVRLLLRTQWISLVSPKKKVSPQGSVPPCVKLCYFGTSATTHTRTEMLHIISTDLLECYILNRLVTAHVPDAFTFLHHAAKLCTKTKQWLRHRKPWLRLYTYLAPQWLQKYCPLTWCDAIPTHIQAQTFFNLCAFALQVRHCVTVPLSAGFRAYNILEATLNSEKYHTVHPSTTILSGPVHTRRYGQIFVCHLVLRDTLNSDQKRIVSRLIRINVTQAPKFTFSLLTPPPLKQRFGRGGRNTMSVDRTLLCVDSVTALKSIVDHTHLVTHKQTYTSLTQLLDAMVTATHTFKLDWCYSERPPRNYFTPRHASS